MTKGNCNHDFWIEECKAFLCNDDDGYYVEEFTAETLQVFIDKVIEIKKQLEKE